MSFKNSINAHGRSEITRIIPSSEGKHLITIAHDSFIRIWAPVSDYDLKLVAEARIPSSYLCAVATTPHLILIGATDGRVLVYDAEALKPLTAFKLHSDLITDMKIYSGVNLVTCSADGSIAITGIQELLKNYPLKQGKEHPAINFNPKYKLETDENFHTIHTAEQLNRIYFAGTNSLVINMSNLETKFIGEYSTIQSIGPDLNLVYGGSKHCIKNFGTDGSTVHFPSQLFVRYRIPSHKKTPNNLNSSLLSLDEGLISKLNIENTDNNMHWKQIRVKELKRGYQIRDAINFRENLYVVGDEGKIHVFCCKELDSIFEDKWQIR